MASLHSRTRAARHGVLPALLLATAAFGSHADPSSSADGMRLDMRLDTRAKAPRRSAADSHFVYQTDGKPLAEVLQDFAASQGLVAVVAEGVSGVVSGKFDTTREGFLDGIAKAYGILWYHDGAALYFYPGKAIQTRLFRLRGYDSREVVELLESLHLGDKRYPVTFNKAHNTLLVSGPPRHIEIVKDALDTLDVGAAENNERVTRIFPLRFASAADRHFGSVVVRGVATTMSALYGIGAPARYGSGDSGPEGNAPRAGQALAMQKLYGTTIKPLAGIVGDKLENKLESQNMAPGASQRGLESPVRQEDERPNFQADEGTNAVIVQGRINRMQEYETLIRRLDQKPQLVELEAMIIDVSTDSVGSLGVDWSLTAKHSSFSLTSPGSSAPTGTTSASVSSSAYSLGTVLSNAGRELLMRVQALQGEGKARIVSKPTVLGVANRSAVMTDKRVATVKVAGNLEANLFQVEAGTMMQVTPQVIAAEGANQIKLSLYIEDGNFESQVVDQVPVVKKTEIRTEAHVREGESLLIGGIIVDEDIDQGAGVPGLRDVPYIGGLFKWNGKRVSRSERLFLITPRLVDPLPPASAAQAARSALQERAARIQAGDTDSDSTNVRMP